MAALAYTIGGAAVPHLIHSADAIIGQRVDFTG
jgi:hypothetical protein